MAKGTDAYRTISEVAKWLGTQSHVLRYWESKFDDVKPMKSSGGRRYYRPDDMQLLGGIKYLLHTDGMTIKGVQQMLVDKGAAHIAALSPVLDLPEKKTPQKKKKQEQDELAPHVDNVIAFTIDPLPLFRPKAPIRQPSLFPDMDAQASLEAQPAMLEPVIKQPSVAPVSEAPMLNLFDDETFVADIPQADITMLLPKLPRTSAFPAKPGILSDLLALDHSDRTALLSRALTANGA
ncbi:MAG: MerR family transcriptional regulator [Planktomarina sp.]